MTGTISIELGNSFSTYLGWAIAWGAPLTLIGRYSLQVFATGCVLTAIGEVMVETRPEEYAYPLTLGAFIVVIVVAFPKGIVGTFEAIWPRRLSPANRAAISSHIETAE